MTRKGRVSLRMRRKRSRAWSKGSVGTAARIRKVWPFNSSFTFGMPSGAVRTSTRWMLSRLAREASFTVVSMLCWKPRSLIQAKDAKATTKTAKYHAVMRARRGSFIVRLRDRENTRNREWCELVLRARPGQSCGGGGGRKRRGCSPRYFPTAAIRRREWPGGRRHGLHAALGIRANEI